MTIIYVGGIEDVIKIHDKTVDISGGGLKGIKSTHSLECALEQIQNDDYYPDFIDKLTHLFFVANKSHTFIDGNKRIAIALGGMFLFKNGFLNVVQRFMTKMEMVSYHVAAGNIDKDLLRAISYSVVYEDDYSDELKLNIVDAISED